MANNGLPNTLSTMLQQLVSNNRLISWNIFENKNGKICCNIQFDMPAIVCASEEPPMHDYTCAYRRISAKQQTRNANRLLHFAKKRKLNPTITAEPSTTHMLSPSTPEQNRTETTEAPSNHVYTPSSVHHVCTPSSVHHMDTPSSVHLVDIPSPVHHVDTPSSVHHVDTPSPVHHMDTPCPVQHMDTLCPVENVDTPSPVHNSVTVSEREEYHDNDSEEIMIAQTYLYPNPIIK